VIGKDSKMAFTEKQQRSYDQYWDAFNYYGYWISAEPIECMEDVFLLDLWKTLVNVEKAVQNIRKRYNYREMSKNVLKALHEDYPRPSFNLQVKP